MPTYIFLVNVIIPKDIIIKKYKGGIDKFHTWFIENNGIKRQEDNELYSVARMNNCDDVIASLVENGLDFDEEKNHSNDFVCVSRYGGMLWDVDWIETNTIFAWHINANKNQIAKATKIGNMMMEDITDALDRGENLFDTIVD